MALKRRRFTPIIQLNALGKFLKRWSSITEASNKTDILQTSIVNCLKGRSKTAGGYQWKLHEKEN